MTVKELIEALKDLGEEKLGLIVCIPEDVSAAKDARYFEHVKAVKLLPQDSVQITSVSRWFPQDIVVLWPTTFPPEAPPADTIR